MILLLILSCLLSGAAVGYAVAITLYCNSLQDEVDDAKRRELRVAINYDRVVEATFQHVGVNIALPDNTAPVPIQTPGWFDRKPDPSFADKATPQGD